jgi:hypothetical protein
VLIECQPRPLLDYEADRGNDRSMAVFISPVIILPLLALIPFMIVVVSWRHPPPSVLWGIFFLVSVPLYGILMWFCYVLPQRDHLVLHRHGLRIGLGWKRLALPLDALAEIRVGREPGVLENLALVITLARSVRLARKLALLNKSALTIVLQSGKKHVLKTLLLRFERRDTERCLQRLHELCPHLKPAEKEAVEEGQG